MTRPAATCELFVNDIRVPDRAYELDDGQPTALTGLSVTWGRDTANEQPGPATCEFLIRDESATSTFLDILHVGSPVTVYAGGQIPGGGGDEGYVQTLDDGTFETWPLGAVDPLRATPTGAALSVTAESGGQVFTVARTDTATLPAAQIPPRTAVGVGGDPSAWDDIPKAILNGATWQLTARAWAQAGVTLALRPVLYFNDQSATGTLGPVVATVTSNGSWLTLSGTYRNTTGDAWLGLSVEATVWPEYTWADQPPDVAWFEKPGRWNDNHKLFRVDDMFAGRPAGATGYRRVLTFSGRVTDITAQPVGDLALEVKVTAADLGAALGNNVIGDNPWPLQPAGDRAARIATLAGLSPTAVLFDAPLNALPVSWRDVDAQPAYPLLQDLAQTVGGVLWTATHAGSGAYLWIENTDNRASVSEFVPSDAAPVLDATNRATNPGLEGGLIAGWNSNDGTRYTIAVDNTAPISGTWSACVTRTANGPSGSLASLYLTGVGAINSQKVTPGVPVTFAFDVRTESNNRQTSTFYIRWIDASNAVLGTTPSQIVQLPPGQVIRLSSEGTPPAACVAAYAYLAVGSTDAAMIPAGERMWLDNLRVSTGPGIDYFDGDFPPAGAYTYKWTGTPQASTSERWLGSFITIDTAPSDAAAVVSACDLLRDPVSWKQDTADVSTVVAVTWQDQTLDDDGLPAPTERTVTIIDSDALAQYGTRRLSIATELTTATDAAALANRALVEARLVGWRLDGLTMDTLAMPDELDSVDDATRAMSFFDLLDGTLRMGLAVVLTDMPAYAPRGAVSAAYVEGGKYAYDAGAWALELTVTPASGQGQSATWSDMDDAGAWTWQQFDPAIRWVDTYGVSV